MTTDAGFRVTFEWKGQVFTRKILTENSFPPPKTVLVVDDTFSAQDFIKKASQGTSFVWKGDFHNSKQLLQAVQRRLDPPQFKADPSDPKSMAKEFYRYRQHQAHKAHLLSRLLIEVSSDFVIDLPRAPDFRLPLQEALVSADEPFLVSLRELQGFVGAHEWRKKGVAIEGLNNEKIHAHFGVFSPVRGEYLDLVAQAPLPPGARKAFEIGVGTGVISALLVRRGLEVVVATDIDPRALSCAKENLTRLNFISKVQLIQTSLFPEGKADLIVCNPPWLPSKPTSQVERAVYDDGSQMLRGFLTGLKEHLFPEGEAWLILSDLAERLGLRGPTELETWIEQSHLQIIECLKILPIHPKAHDEGDSLYQARSQEVTKLFRLKLKN